MSSTKSKLGEHRYVMSDKKLHWVMRGQSWTWDICCTCRCSVKSKSRGGCRRPERAPEIIDTIDSKRVFNFNLRFAITAIFAKILYSINISKIVSWTHGQSNNRLKVRRIRESSFLKTGSQSCPSIWISNELIFSITGAMLHRPPEPATLTL